MPGNARPLNYTAAKVNQKIFPPPRKTPAPMSDRPRVLAYGEVVKDEFPHMEPTLCCKQGCRIHDVIIFFPVKQNNEITGHALVHAGCLRTFMEKVPVEISVVKERVGEILDQFIVE